MTSLLSSAAPLCPSVLLECYSTLKVVYMPSMLCWGAPSGASNCQMIGLPKPGARMPTRTGSPATESAHDITSKNPRMTLVNVVGMAIPDILNLLCKGPFCPIQGRTLGVGLETPRRTTGDRLIPRLRSHLCEAAARPSPSLNVSDQLTKGLFIHEHLPTEV